jgi:hypothetical protein
MALDVRVVGLALDDQGFTAYNTISGLGLNTFGFLWGCNEIWAPTEEAIVTTWSACADIPNPTVESCPE